jgi:Fe-Mn family superoxide dismutase
MFNLPDLPYAYEALAPVVSPETLHFHHDKHHAKYVEVMNGLLEQAARPPQPLEDVVWAAGSEGAKKLYNNAAQTWNHAFFWDSMTPGGASAGDSLKEAAERGFGDWDALRARFVAEGSDHFASGWVWLIARGGGLEVISTHDAGSFDQFEGATPLLVCDVWEHAYYLDHQNNRKAFLEQWFDGLANWSLAESQLAAAGGSGGAWRFPQPAG